MQVWRETGISPISTHTLTWSVTGGIGHVAIATGDFNSHAHVERDQRLPQVPLLQLHFNSHAHVERDLLVSSVTLAVSQFQLTRSRGA